MLARILRRCLNIKPPYNQHRMSAECLMGIAQQKGQLKQCWFNVGSASQMVAQHWVKVYSQIHIHQPGLLNFADFSVDSQPIFIKFYTNYFPFMS